MTVFQVKSLIAVDSECNPLNVFCNPSFHWLGLDYEILKSFPKVSFSCVCFLLSLCFRPFWKTWLDKYLGSGARKIIIPLFKLFSPPISQSCLHRPVIRNVQNSVVIFPAKIYYTFFSLNWNYYLKGGKNKLLSAIDFTLSAHAVLLDGNP